MLDLSPLFADIFLAVGALTALMIGAFRGEGSAKSLSYVVIGILAVAGYILFSGYHGAHVLFNGMFVTDGFSLVMKGLVLAGSAVAIYLSLPFFEKEGDHRFEYPVLILLATLGMFAMISANSLLSLYMGLELQSLSLYVLATIRRDNLLSNEAGLKYFILGALSSGILLYGISMIYGYAGTIGYQDLADIFFLDTTTSPGLVVGLVFVAAGLAFKISAAPFHMWTPDVYQGAPTPVTAFFAMVPKLAAFAVLTRLLMHPFGDLLHEWQQVVIALSVASMTLGAFAALAQNNIKRLLAYSSIGYMGYALIGLAAGTVNGVESIVFYLFIYLLTSAGVFAVVLALRHKEKLVEKVTDLTGLSKTNPRMALIMTILMFSMAGIPPMAGFLGKLYVFKAAVEANLVPLAIYGVLTSVVGAYYYLRIIKLMYFDDPVQEIDTPVQSQLNWVMSLSAIAISIIIIIPGFVMNAASFAAETFLN